MRLGEESAHRRALVILGIGFAAVLALWTVWSILVIYPGLVVLGVLFLMACVGYDILTALPQPSRRKQWLAVLLLLPLAVIGPLISLYFLSFRE